MSTIFVNERVEKGPRNALQALWRGFRGRCPACGQGRVFHAYLKVSDHCPACGEELHHQRADDAPPYITMFVVGHLTVALLLAADAVWSDAPMWIEAVVWSALAILLSLLLLPRIKGAMVALQWSLRMHGFGAPSPVTDRSEPSI